MYCPSTQHNTSSCRGGPVCKGSRHNISEKPSRYTKDISESCCGFPKGLFRISKLTVQYVFMLEIRNVSDFSSQCFGHHISDIVSYIRKAFRICYDPSPKGSKRINRRIFFLPICMFQVNDLVQRKSICSLSIVL